MAGPHKDDVGITLNGQEAKFYASEGQKQTIVAALKLAEWQRLYKKSEEKPIFLIDDIGLGMDSRRRGRFYREIESMGQVFVTSTERPPLKDMNLISLGSL
jgi:DNA replication and repair protein RecF